MEFRHHPRRSTRVLTTFVALAAACAAGLSGCASSTATGSHSALPSGTPSSALVTPGGPILSPSPTPTPGAPGTTTPGAPTTGHPTGIPAGAYSTAGTVLTVYFEAGVCDRYGVTANQSQAGKVLITVVITQRHPNGQMCPMAITPHHASVDLGSPLDGRQVVDTATGRALQQQPWTGGKESHGPVGSGNS
ncbi:hypothetical protein [Streptacidiphilus rugosus]|uniref:hypothetical protein n=1 Tax=Streptacidiphilus rugosus TaxID=405783 RepID=UPI000B328D8F|nr:hypothetical protein [Streptacidiphilus rugosus]